MEKENEKVRIKKKKWEEQGDHRQQQLSTSSFPSI